MTLNNLLNYTAPFSIGSNQFLINSTNNNLYLKKEGCEDSILYNLNFDIDNWKFDLTERGKMNNIVRFKFN